MGFLLRCAVRNQWIDLVESNWLHSRLAIRAQFHYGSWMAYFNGFVVGRTFWCCLSTSDDELAGELTDKATAPITCGSPVVLRRTFRTFSPICLGTWKLICRHVRHRSRSSTGHELLDPIGHRAYD